MARSARHEDAGPAHGTARQDRPRRRCIFGRASEGEKGLLSRLRVAPAARPGAPPATRFWWHGVV